MPIPFTAYAVFDESGDAGNKHRSSRYLIVAAIVCSNLEPLRRSIIRIRRKMPKSLRGKAEVHAVETPEAARPILKSLAAMDTQIYIAIVDKQRKRDESAVELMLLAYTACTSAALAHEDGIIATIDRPFGNETQRNLLLNAMSDTAEEMGKRLLVVMEDSQHEKALQVADVVAWSFFQKYEHGNSLLADILGERVVTEMILPLP